MLRTALLILCGAMLPLAATTHPPRPVEANPAASAEAETTLKVTAQYTGAGKVDATHRLWVSLFDRAMDPSAHVPPIATQALTVNGGVANFTAIVPGQVWVGVIYDEKGGYTAEGPPPSGSPTGTYLVNYQPAPVTPGPSASIQITFNDQFRIP